MKSKIHNFTSCAAMVMALVAVFVCASPEAYASHSSHSGWKTIGSGSRKTLDSGEYYLTDDLNCDLVINGQVELCLNGHSVSGNGKGSVITVSEGASLELHDCSGKGSVTGGKATEGGGIYVGENAAFSMDGGKITGNEANRGGGIYAAKTASVSIAGGVISGNSAKSGGGIFLRCPVQLSDVKISENTAEYNGAGIYAEGETETVLSADNCIIEHNGCLGHGGGVYLKNCQFNMSSGSINDNQATDAYASGGGVYIGEYAGFSMAEGVRIENNSAANEGGGICVSGGTPISNFSMNGGSISGNSAKTGGGIATTGIGSFEINGGTIRENSAGGDGGGIYISFAFTKDVNKLIADCDIDGNSAGNYGGGIFMQGNGFISAELRGSSIRRNSALDGGGVYVNTLEDLTLSGRLHINGNQCSGRGANLYLHSGETMSVSALEHGSDIGLSLEYTDKNTFTKDAGANAEMLKDCFTSNIPDFSVSVGAGKELQLALACRVDFDAKGGKLAESYAMYTTGNPLGQLPVPHKDGYTFTYWDYNGRRVNESDPVSFDKTLSANYEFNNYTVNYDANGGSGSMASQACRYTVPFNLRKCSFTMDGHVFKGWSLSPDGPVKFADGESAGSLCKEADGSLTLYAQWGMAPASAISLESSVKLATGESRALSVSAEPLGSDISGLVWLSSDEEIVSVDSEGRLTGAAPGKAVITAALSEGASATCSVEVGRRSPEKADFVFSEERSFVCDGGEKAPALLSFPEGMDLTVSYIRAEDGERLSEAPIGPGSYDICIDVAESERFTAAEGITDEGWSFSVSPGEQQALSIVNAPEAVYYGQAFTLAAQGGSGDGPVRWELSAGDAAIVNGETGDIFISGMGDFTVTATKAGNAMYGDASASMSFSVSRRQLYLESQPSVAMEKTYDGSDAAQLLDMGLIKGFSPDDEGSIPVAASARFEDSNAGFGKLITVSYDLGDYSAYYDAPEDAYIYGGAIYPRAASIGWNYSEALTYNCGEQYVSAYVANALEGDSVSCAAYEGAAAVDAGSYTATVTALDNGNYTLDGAEGNSLWWSIRPRTITVAGAELHKTYGEADPMLDCFSMDEAPLAMLGQLSRDYGEDVGSYVIRQGNLSLTDGPGFTAGNYVLNFIDGLLTVDMADNAIYDFYCGDVAYGAEPMPGAQAAFGYVSFSYSQDPEGWFGPWDRENMPGLWYVKASVEGTHNYAGAEAIIPFTVLNEEIQALIEPEPVHISADGDIFSKLAAALPMDLGIMNTRGLISSHRAQVWWDIEYLSYDAAIPGAQVITVSGTAALPMDVNNSFGASMDVSIQVYIEPGFESIAPLPDGTGNALAPIAPPQLDEFL